MVVRRYEVGVWLCVPGVVTIEGEDLEPEDLEFVVEDAIWGAHVAMEGYDVPPAPLDDPDVKVEYRNDREVSPDDPTPGVLPVERVEGEGNAWRMSS